MVDNDRAAPSTITTFVVLLVPAVALAAISWWTFGAKWIGGAVLVVGLSVAAYASRRSPEPARLLLLVLIQVTLLIATAVVGVMIDCARHCS